MKLAEPTEVARAEEWQAAKREITELLERIAQHGYLTVPLVDHEHAHNRYTAASTALRPPQHLLTYDRAQWEPGSGSFGELQRSERYRRACDQWSTERRLARDDFLEVQRWHLDNHTV